MIRLNDASAENAGVDANRNGDGRPTVLPATGVRHSGARGLRSDVADQVGDNSFRNRAATPVRRQLATMKNGEAST